MVEKRDERLYDPYPDEGMAVGEAVRTGRHALGLLLAVFLCLIGIVLALNVFLNAGELITEPDTLESTLSKWESMLAPIAGVEGTLTEPPVDPELSTDTPAVDSLGTVPPASKAIEEDVTSDPRSFLRAMHALLQQAAEGKLARPIGGFLIFLFFTVQSGIALAFLRTGATLLRRD